MQYSSVVDSFMLQWWWGGGGMTLLATLLCGVIVALFIIMDDFGGWRHCFCGSATELFSQIAGTL